MTEYPLRDRMDVLREFLHLRAARALDVGCGDGSLVRMMARDGAETVGLEISEDKLSAARSESPAGSESYRVGVAQSLPFHDRAFDVVLFYNSLHHVPVEHQDEALSEAARVLETDGLLFVIEPLSEGPFFELMRPVDDETEVRAAAYGALRGAANSSLFDEIREYTFATTYEYRSFEDLKDHILRVDDSRRAALEAHEGQLREAFERTAVRTDGGYGFTPPNRLNLLKRL